MSGTHPTAAGEDGAAAFDGRTPELPLDLPRLPVLDWPRLRKSATMRTPSVLDLPHRRFVRSGRVAIALALRAAGIALGDRVLVPTCHCPTMIAPVVAAGATPMFFGIDASGAPQLDRIGDTDLRGVRAMIAAHYFGVPGSMAAVRRFCDAHSIVLIEDCAHAMFGMAGTQAVGTWGHYAIASLTKFFPVTDGGCIAAAQPLALPAIQPRPLYEQAKAVANGLELAAKHRRLGGAGVLLRGLFRVQNRLRRNTPAPDPSPETEATGNSIRDWLDEVTGFQASAPAATSFARWLAVHADRERIVALRRRNFLRLAELLSDLPGARPLHRSLPAGAVPYVFPLFVDDPDACYQRVRASGIPIFRWDEVWPDTPVIDGDNGAAWATRLFQIGCHQDLTLDDLAAMAATLRRIFDARS